MTKATSYKNIYSNYPLKLQQPLKIVIFITIRNNPPNC